MIRLAYRAIVCTCPTCTASRRPVSLGLLCERLDYLAARARAGGWRQDDAGYWTYPGCAETAHTELHARLDEITAKHGRKP